MRDEEALHILRRPGRTKSGLPDLVIKEVAEVG
jgi:hypothetical protein